MSPTRHKASPAPGDELAAHLHFTLGPGSQQGARIANPLFDLLQAVLSSGSITQAARSLGCSYRHAWGQLREWEATLGEPLIAWTQGQPARLTPFGERLLWAERRARTRMQPHIEALRSDLGRIFSEARDEQRQTLTICASHDTALPLLRQHAADTAKLHLDIRFQGSSASLQALNAGQCLVAGFQVPALRGAAPVFAAALKPLLEPGRHKLIGCARRRQGLMMRSEHAGALRTLADLARIPLRFVNREAGSGTRLLTDHLLHEFRIDPAAIAGYHEHTEHTHVAVAATIASGQADAGVGIEAAALEFGLHFVPLVEEDYFLASLKANLEDPAVRRLRGVLEHPDWSRLLDGLPGYAPASAPGQVLMMTAALPWWRYLKSKVRGEVAQVTDEGS